MEGTGGRCQIVASDSGYYFVHRERPRQSEKAVDPKDPGRAPAQASDAGSRQIMWKAVPVEKGYWRLVNCENGKFLADRGDDGALAESRPQDGALEQQWRVEPTPE